MTNDIRLWIYPGASPNSTVDLWEPNYADVSAYVRQPGNDGGRVIQYSSGKQDESTQTDAGQMTLTLDNRDGRFSTDKIDGPYYGKIDTGCPIRLAVVAGSDSFTRTLGSGGFGGSWTQAGGYAPAFSVDGSKGQVAISAANNFVTCFIAAANARDTDTTTTIYPNATATGASYSAGHIVRATSTNDMIFSTIEFNTGGDVTIKVRNRVSSVDTEVASVNPIPGSSYTAGVPWVLRTQADGDYVRVKAWPLAGSQPTSWQINISVSQATTGNNVGMYFARYASNTNTGNIMGVDDYLNIGIEWTGYVVSWPLAWDQTANNSWAPITASGILRRLRQGTNPIQSPLRRQLSGTAGVTGYWPLEDGASSLYGIGTVAGTPVATANGVTFAQDNTLPGGGPAPTITAASGGNIIANVKNSQGGTGFAAMVLFKIPSLPSSKTRLVRIRCSRGPAPIFDFSIDATTTIVEAIAADGTVINSVVNSYGQPFAGNWIAWQLETDNSVGGGNTAMTAIYHQIGSVAYYVQNFNLSGTALSNVYSMSLEGPQGTAYGHMWMGANTLPFVTNAFSLVSSGYAGETAISRFVRVCGEAGITCSVRGGTSQTSEPMGAQKESSTMAVLQSCADTDFGVIVERGGGLQFVPKVARWNLTQTMGITLAAGQIAKIPAPVRDDQKLKNRWTISRTGGGSATYQNDASVALNGTWEDSLTVNSYDDSVLLNRAAWNVYYGTILGLRWPLVSLNFSKSPELLAAWRTRQYGWRLGITTGLTQVRGNEPDLIVEGYVAQLDPYIWSADLNCTDASVWTVGVTDDTGIYGRADNEYCTSTALISSTATTIPITTGQVQGVNMPIWDNTAGLWSGGVDFNVGGERVTVTSITNNGGQAQTLNVTVRGVNGYAASHPSGTQVSLWYPATVAL